MEPGRVLGYAKVLGVRSVISTVGTGGGGIAPWAVDEWRGENCSMGRKRLDGVGSGELDGDL